MKIKIKLYEDTSLEVKTRKNLNNNFRKWFSDSVVTNEDGSPKIVYHGTVKEFDKFVPSLRNDIGSHFGNTHQANFITISDINSVDLESEYYKGMHILPCYVRIEKPLYIEDLVTWDIESMSEFLMEHNLISPNMLNSLKIRHNNTYYGKDERPDNADEEQTRIKEILIYYLKKAGYDGIIYDNTSEGEGESYMVFDSNQVKSIFNKGTWSNNTSVINESEDNIVKAYKLFRVNKKYPGKLFSLFVDSNTPVPFNTWIDAKHIPPDETGGIKSKLGRLSYRPGWHSGDSPVATHIGLRGKGTKPEFRNPDYVWAEVLVNNEVDWQTVAKQRAKISKSGKPVSATAHITDQLPKKGFYRYKTNPNMQGSWLISGEIKVLRVLNDQQVEEINKRNNVADLPRTEPLNLEVYGFDSNGEPK